MQLSYYEGKAEEIVMGCGIAFKKRVGDKIEEEKIDKVFALENKDTNTKLQQLLKDIPMEYVEVSEKIIEYARTKAERNLNDFIYITLWKSQLKKLLIYFQLRNQILKPVHYIVVKKIIILFTTW